MGQFLAWAKRRGKPLIRTFFQGDAIEAGAEAASDVMASPSTFWADGNRGLPLPWTLAARIGLGVSLMLTRWILGSEGAMATRAQVVGERVITDPILAPSDVARALSFPTAP